MTRYLVTGGAGFIGSHICEFLVKNGKYVRILDNFSSGKEENLKSIIGRVEVIRGDIRDKQTCINATGDIDAVLHQAALRSVPKSLVNPSDYNEVNIQGTLNMLEACRKNQVQSFVFASSSSVYGDAERFPEKEDDLPKLISPYALSKLAGEYYCKIFSTHYGLNTTALRYFNVFGPRQAVDDEYAVVIPKFITCMLRNEQPPIFGNGKQSRDFSYVANVVEANILASLLKESKGEVFNIAGGQDYTILELVKILNKILGKNIKPVLLPKRAGDVFKTRALLTKSKKILKFTPRVDFVQGLKFAVEYFQNKNA
ncbi:MAG: NAD-dependent epimerase/dehydratase family protein [Candidatus Omnitrophota bacterium]